ncbi:MAG: DMT family transporter [Odoribacter sp.]|nr:DMT family transporter [Odoribacter sp.]
MKAVNWKGYIYGIIAAMISGIVPLLVYDLITEGIDVISILFFRFTVALPAVFVFLKHRGRHINIGTDRILPICGLGILVAITFALLYTSFTKVDLGLASSIFYIYPLIIALLMAGFFHEILRTQAFAAIICCLAGIWLIGGFTTTLHVSPSGLVMLTVAALLYAIYHIAINDDGLRGVSTLTMTFWITLTCAFIFGLIIVVRGYAMVPHTPLNWLYILLIAVCPTIISFIFTEKAVNLSGHISTAVLGVFEPITVIVGAAIIYGQTINMRSLIGIVLILASVSSAIATRNISRRILKIRHILPSIKPRSK